MSEEIFEGLTKDDVWGKYCMKTHKKLSAGMIVARGIPYKPNSPEGKDLIKKTGLPAKCPIIGDVLGYKSVSVVCEAKDQQAVEYWLEYVHGGGCVEGTAKLEDDKIMIRSNYMCW